MNHVILEKTSHHRSLYSPQYEHDACGVGFVASIHGKRSHTVLDHGLTALRNLAHRGAVDADAKTGDGAGVLTQIPYRILAPEVARLGHTLYHEADLGVGFLFLPHDNAYAQAWAKAITEEVIRKHGLFLFGWREVPINLNVLGEKAQLTMPRIEQVLVGAPAGISSDEYERRLFLVRNEVEKRAARHEIRHFYIPSFSHRMIIYKGLLVSPSLEKFYRDLARPEYDTALCVYHSRYSTNTFPTWPLGQPFRMLAHNGEINTRRGNVNWMRAREAELASEVWGEKIESLKPIIQPGGSDSAELDNALEALVMSGRNILHAMTMLVPPAWRADHAMSQELQDFHQYHQAFNEPWDGPAALVFSDGQTVGACLDRNGLRPARYKLTDDGIFSLGSEVGTIEFDDEHVIEKGRLAPGEMIAVDTLNGLLLRDDAIMARLAAARPYGQWVRDHLKPLESLVTRPLTEPEGELDILTLTQKQIAAGYSSEELDMILRPMVAKAAEGVGSMGDDTPLAVLSEQPRLLYTYFKQLFAQVTNPPIDPIREKLVMSLTTGLGWRRNLLGETPEHADLILARSPILLENELAALEGVEGYPLEVIPTLWPVAEGEAGLEPALEAIGARAEEAVRNGARLVVLTDRGIDHENVGVPMLLATGAVHHRLIRAGLRMKASLICDVSEARDVHQIACLIGYGASAVCPYLAFETCRELLEKDRLKPEAKRQLEGIGYVDAVKNLRKALEGGLLKIMSKMGISVLSSYHGAQIFEAIGVGEAVIGRAFTGTPSKVGGIGFPEIARESLQRHGKAYGSPVPLDKDGTPLLADAGYYRFRRDGETHAVTPPLIKNFHTFVRGNKPEDYEAYLAALRQNRPIALRDLFELVPSPDGPVPLEEVEPIEEIRRRFTTAGMSLGALSPEAHECLAIAMNRIGGKSNSGEGGEDPERFTRRENGDLANSAIKQVASARFGVHAAYLASAKEIEIKMAQGSKPGEGGQLPGFKVSELIARLRHTVPGVMLISPPPHHDIYSIEDLAQLIHDLKEVNPRARICVKLVAEAGVGTIAAGVAKAHADIILISGHDGGTGASPLSSVKNAGSAWELGIAEAQQVLVMNGLRNRVTLRTDGGLRNGLDIIHATILGAEEYNFGTIALIAAGCVYVRQCHLNNCPVGIATQDDRYRAKFKGRPEHVINFFTAVAEEVRATLAALGVRSIEELVGRTEFVRQRHVEGHPKANTLDLSRLLANIAPADESPRHNTRRRNDAPVDDPLDDVILQDAKDAISGRRPTVLSYEINNMNRSVGCRVSGEIGYQWGHGGLPEGTLELRFTGSAGQSFGAFLSTGVRMVLEGESNDYVGKGMSGGSIAVRPPARRAFVARENAIIGNTVLYGATGGHLYAAGRAGERFAVRNSGATAVVEGIGDHGCEYMTNGVVVVLGPTGKNFAAGMTGGVAYVLDCDDSFSRRCNGELVGLERLDEAGIAQLQPLIYQHLEATDSGLAREILARWPDYAPKFWKVVPHAVREAQEGEAKVAGAVPATQEPAAKA